MEELERLNQVQRTKLKEDMNVQLEQLEMRKQAMKEEELNERLWVTYHLVCFRNQLVNPLFS